MADAPSVASRSDLPEGRPPRAVLFDVGNVVVRWDPRRLYSKLFDDPAELDRFLAEVCTMDWHARHDAGLAMADNARELAARHPEHADAIAAWDARWDEMFDGVIAETVDCVEALWARGVPMVALTNMPAEKAAGVFAMSPAFGRFRDIVVSGVEGVIKPEPRAFEIACERSGLAPEDLLFVDDSPVNVAAAERLGFHVHLFREADGLRPTLERHGLL